MSSEKTLPASRVRRDLKKAAGLKKGERTKLANRIVESYKAEIEDLTRRFSREAFDKFALLSVDDFTELATLGIVDALSPKKRSTAAARLSGAYEAAIDVASTEFEERPTKEMTAAAEAELEAVSAIFSDLSKKHVERPRAEVFERMLDKALLRRRMLKDIFSSDEGIEEYVRSHKDATLLNERIKSAVSAKRPAIRWIAAKSGFTNIKKASVIAKCRALVEFGAVEPSKLFPEIPIKLSLCDLHGIIEWLRKVGGHLTPEKLEYFNEIIDENMHAVRIKWLTITGEDLGLSWPSGLPDLSKLPRVGELEEWKAPAPARPAWSKKLYSLEAEKMGHRPALRQRSLGPKATDLKGDAEAETSSPAVPPIGADEIGEGGKAAYEAQAAGSQHYLNAICDISKFDLYSPEGIRAVKQPVSPQAPRYTFPQDLRRAEDVFYDYCLIIPVNECGPWREESRLNPRSLLAARLLVGKAQTVLRFLDHVGLSQSLGHYPLYRPPEGETMFVLGEQRKVVDDVASLLKEVLQLRECMTCPPETQAVQPASIDEIRSVKKRLEEMAGVVRLLSRSEMFLSDISGANPHDCLEALDAALSRLPAFDTKDTWLPTTKENAGEEMRCKTLRFYENKTYADWGHDPNVNGNMNVPDARMYKSYDINYFKNWPYSSDTESDEDEGDPWEGWMWLPRKEQREDLRNYVRYVGEDFAPLLSDLKLQAEKMSGAVHAFAGDYTQFALDFARLATGMVHSAASALAHLLEEISNQLLLPECSRQEGNKRLALQVIFRQYWHPDGYVQGKLVGYKNLLPNQKDTLKRRTFVKTTREVTTAEEFAAARQEDYSHSQKDSAEVTKEASNKFNFSASTTGSYDFLVASGDYTLSASSELANASKTVQKRVCESARKGSYKYNEKREVKIRELTEVEDLQEVSSELHNANAEITANYFYYQLLRQYRVAVRLQDIRPVLLRAKDVPSPAEIDGQFISKHMHILIHHLPSQLSVDAQENAERLGLLVKTLIRRRADLNQRDAELEVFKLHNPPPAVTETEQINVWREQLRSRTEAATEARKAFIETEEDYSAASSRMNRVINHVRENIVYYMQFIWQASPKIDGDMLLRDEEFHGQKLPEITRGLIRQGYYGNEELFDYTGSSIALFNFMLDNLIPGSEILSQLRRRIEDEELEAGKLGEQKLAHGFIRPKLDGLILNATVDNGRSPILGEDYDIDFERGAIEFFKALDVNKPTVSYDHYEKLAGTELFQYLERYYEEDYEALIENIERLAFPSDPADPDPLEGPPPLSMRTVQVAQDALVVETMPGQIPLLEGFQMAHRMLDVQKSCLENVHLAERMVDRPWKDQGKDDYEVTRHEGAAAPAETE